MADLSFDGRMNLLIHVQKALHPDSDGFDVNAVVADSLIQDGDIRNAIEKVYLEFDRPIPNLKDKNRVQLALALGNVLGIPDELSMSGTVTINPTATWKESIDNSAVHIGSQRQSAINQGPTANITDRILRIIRHSAGWIPLSRVAEVELERDLVDNLRATYIADKIKSGDSPEKAENAAQRDYIAVTQKYYVPRFAGRPLHEKTDFSRPTVRHVDLSPQAIDDFQNELPKRQAEVTASVTFNQFCEYQLPFTPHKTPEDAKLAAVDLRNKEIRRLEKEQKLPHAYAVIAVNKNYIEIKEEDETISVRRLYPRAQKDLGKVLKSNFEKARALAEENKGTRRDLVNDGTVANLAAKLDAILNNKDSNGITFGAANQYLRVSQQETLEKFSGALHNSALSGYAVLPGGCGKTRIGVASCAAAKDANLRSLYVVPSILAAEGVCKEISACRPDISIGRVYDEHAEFDKDITVIVYNSLYRHFYKSLLAQNAGASYPFNLRDYQFIVADEAHSYLTELADHILKNTDAVKLALTATDKYYEGKEVKNQFGQLINRVDLEQAFERKEILKPKYRCIETKVDLGLDEINDLDQRDELFSQEFERHINTPQWNQVFVDVWRADVDPENNKRIAGEKTFVHCAGVKQAEAVADQFNKHLEPLLKGDEDFRSALRDKKVNPDKVEHIAATISDKMSLTERQDLLDKYNRREILVLTSAKMLVESVDDPGTSVIMNAVPTYSRVRSAQRGYRGSRTKEGKDSWYIYEALPANWENSQYAPVLFAEATEDPQIEGIRGVPRSKAARNDEAAIETPEGYKIHWEYKDIADIINRLLVIRLRRQGLEALDPDWLEEQDNQRGLYLKALRVRAKLGLMEAAEKIGITGGILFNYERGIGLQMHAGRTSGFGVTKLIESIRSIYRTTPEEEQKLLYLFIPALDPTWKNDIALEDRLPKLLKSYRLRAGLKVDDVSELLNISPTFGNTLGKWESGKSRPDRIPPSDMSIGKFVDDIKKIYNLTKIESSQLLEAFLPALNKKWLSLQPQDQQLGLLLKAYRLRGTTFTRNEAEEKLGFSLKAEKRPGITIGYRLGIPLEEIATRVKTLYHLSDAETLDLKNRIIPSLPGLSKEVAEWAEIKSRREALGLSLEAAAEKIGVKWTDLANWERKPPPLNRNSGIKEHILDIIRAYDIPPENKDAWIAKVLPPLSDEWLQAQPEKLRFGLMLRAYRQHMGEIQDSFAENLGVTGLLYGKYENGIAPIPDDVLERITQRLKEKCAEIFDEEKFKDTCKLSNEALAPKRRSISPKGSHVRERTGRSPSVGGDASA